MEKKHSKGTIVGKLSTTKSYKRSYAFSQCLLPKTDFIHKNEIKSEGLSTMVSSGKKYLISKSFIICHYFHVTSQSI